MIDIATDVQRHQLAFFTAALVLTALAAGSALVQPSADLAAALFILTTTSAIAAAIVWIAIADWALTPFCPRCGAEMVGTRTVLRRRPTRFGHWLTAKVHHVCKRCGHRAVRHYSVTKPVRDLHKRQGISRYWRFR